MNHAHTVPPVAVPYTSPENAPVGETGWQPAAPRTPTVGTGVGEKWAAVGEEAPAGPLSDGVQAHATASAKNVAIAPRDISSPSLRPKASPPTQPLQQPLPGGGRARSNGFVIRCTTEDTYRRQAETESGATHLATTRLNPAGGQRPGSSEVHHPGSQQGRYPCRGRRLVPMRASSQGTDRNGDQRAGDLTPATRSGRHQRTCQEYCHRSHTSRRRPDSR